MWTVLYKTPYLAFAINKLVSKFRKERLGVVGVSVCQTDLPWGPFGTPLSEGHCWRLTHLWGCWLWPLWWGQMPKTKEGIWKQPVQVCASPTLSCSMRCSDANTSLTPNKQQQTETPFYKGKAKPNIMTSTLGITDLILWQPLLYKFFPLIFLV